MADENGWSEPFRVRFPVMVEITLRKMAHIENRSVPSLIQSLTIEALAKRNLEKVLSSTIESIMRGEDLKW